MLYILLAVILLIAAVTLLRIRVRLELSRQQRLVFVGLGRSGPEFDLQTGRSSIKILGLRVKGSEERKKEKVGEKKPRAPKKKKKKESKRYRPVGDILKVLPATARALANYGLSIVKSFYVEQLEGELQGGFDQPDLTGTAYGFYQAALGVAPATAGRFRFIPDWDGPSFGGWARVSVAIPVYRIIGRTVVLFFKLPLRDLLKLAIGRKKGDQDVQ